MKKLLFIALLFIAFAGAAQAQTTCGYTSVGGSTLSSAPNRTYAVSACAPAANSTITDCKIYTGASGGNVQCGLYDSDGSSGAPKTVLCQGTPVSAAAGGWNTITMSGCPTLAAGHTYYIAFNNTASAVSYKYTSGTAYYHLSETCCTLTTYAFASTAADKFSAYFDLMAVGGPVGLPTATYGTGTYANAVSEQLASTTTAATICYTTDATTPTTDGNGTCTHGTAYTTPFNVPPTAGTGTVKAIGSKSGFTDSVVATFTYTFTAAAPTFTPAAGILNYTQTVALASTTMGAAIYYTTDGSTPTTGSALYSTPITVSAAETIKALATATNYNNSSVASAAYTFITGTPSFSPAAGNYSSPQTVTISDSTSGAAIQYCLSNLPSCTPNVAYSAPIMVAADSYLCSSATSSYGASATNCGVYLHPNTVNTDTLVVSVGSAEWQSFWNANLVSGYVAMADTDVIVSSGGGVETQQIPLDLYSTGSKWYAFQESDVVPIMDPVTTGSYATAANTSITCGGYQCPIVRVNEGYFPDHASQVSCHFGYSCEVAVRCATDGSLNCSFVRFSASGEPTFVNILNGVTTTSQPFSITPPTGDYSVELRVEGCTFSLSGAPQPTTVPGCYLGGGPGFGIVATAWSGYNIDGSSPSGYTAPPVAYKTYSYPMTDSSSVGVSAWYAFQSSAYGSGSAWGGELVPVPISGGYVAGTAALPTEILMLEKPFGVNQWAATTVWMYPWNTFNYFLMLQAQPFSPGQTSGVCLADNYGNKCYDPHSYFMGINYLSNYCPTTKDPYACTPFVFGDKVTPWSTDTDGLNPGSNHVQLIEGSYTTALPGDQLMYRYENGYLSGFCKHSPTPNPPWSAGMGMGARTNLQVSAGNYTTSPTFIEASGKIWMASTSGTSGLVQPTWPTNPQWTVASGGGTGTTVQDGSGRWMYFGNACPTTATWTRIFRAYDGDMANPATIPPGYTHAIGTGFPGLFAGGCYGAGTTCPEFSNFSAGTVGITGDPCLSGACTVGGVQNVPSWLLP